MKHINIALFVPHLGCPHRCSFCNQSTISGSARPLAPKEVTSAVNTALLGRDCSEGEIAFFGGSFTAIDEGYMISLLEAAYPFVQEGQVKGIRCSTRPDCITGDILHTLENYGVTTIELGCQSMDDEVLRLNKRGHDSTAVVNAARLIKQHGFNLGLQMMTGLYGSTEQKDIYSAQRLMELKPDFVRIYPTVILENTENADRYKKGEYMPMDLNSAVSLCSKILQMFEQNDIPVIRLGLHSGGKVEDGYVAGAYHPAFRELCESEICFQRLSEELKNVPKGKITVTVDRKSISRFYGQKKINIERLRENGYEAIFLQSDNMGKYEFVIST